MDRWATRRARTTARLAPDDAFFQGAILCLLIGSVLAYGGTTLGARAAGESVALFLALCAALRMAARQAVPVDALRLALPFGLLIALGIVQLVPLPLVLRVPLGAAPEHALRIPLVSTWQPISLNSAATLGACSTLAAAGIVFVLGQVAVSRANARLFAALLVGAGGLVAAAGIISVVEPGTLFPILTGVSNERARGPFVNPDHFANWLAALLPLGLAGVLGDTRRSSHARAYLLASLAALPFMATALGLTFSRGGTLAALCGVTFFALGLIEQRRLRVVIGTGALVIGVLAYTAWAGGVGLGARFAELWYDPLGDMRIPIWTAAADALQRTPVLGSGLGTFLEGARSVVGPAIPSRIAVDYAHNEILQVGVEAGVVGLCIVAAGVACWLRALSHLRAKNSHDRAAVLSRAAEAGVLALFAGSLVDFPLHLPATALLAAVLAALAVAVFQRDAHARPIGRSTGVVLAGVALALFAVMLPRVWRPYRAARMAAMAAPLGADADWSGAVQDLIEATVLQPRAAVHHDALARLLADAADRAWTGNRDLRGQPFASEMARAQAAQALYVRAVNAQLDAIAAQRTNPQYRRDLGWLFGNLAVLEEAFSAMPFTPQARLDRIPLDVEPSAAALPLYQDAVQLEPRNAAWHQALGDWALQHLDAEPNRGLGLAVARTPLEEIARDSLRTALALDPGRLEHVIQTVTARGADYADVRAVSPGAAAALWRLALALETQGRFDWTERVLDELLADPTGVAPTPDTEVLADRLAQRPDAASARHPLQELALVPGVPPTVLGALANVDWHTGDFAGAQAEFTAAIAALPPSSARVRLDRALGFLLLDRNDLDAADAYFEHLLQQRSYDPWLYLGRGIVADRRGDWPAASRAYDRARALAGNDDDLYYRLGHRYFGRGLHQQATVVWEDGLRLNPDSGQMHLWLARAYDKTLQRDAAIRHYQEVLRLQPTNDEARQELDALLGRHAG